MPTDTERLDFLQRATRASTTGISFDWVPAVEGERSGYRFMRRWNIGEPSHTLRDAIDAAMRTSPPPVATVLPLPKQPDGESDRLRKVVKW